MKKTNRIIALIVSIAMIAGVMTVLPVISTAETANPFAGDHYVYFSSIGYGRIFKFTVDSLEGSATVDSVFQSQDYDGTGRISSGGGSVTVNWTVTGESMSVVVSNFEGNPENTYLQQIDKLVVDGLSTGYTADAGNHCFSFTTTNTGSAHLLSFTNTAYGRLYVFNINGTSGTVSNLLPLLRDDTTAGWAAYVSLDSTEAVNIEYTADADGNVTLNVGGWSYPSQCSGFVAIDTLLNGNLNNNAASASGADGVLTAAFTGVALPNLAAVEEALPAPGNLLITAKDGVANAFAGDHYVYFSSIGYGRIFKFTVDSPEGSATVDCVYASEDFSGGRISSGGGSVTVNWTVTGESMSVVVSNFNGNPEDTYLQQIEKLVVDGLSTGYTADAGNHCFSFTTTNTGSAHLLSFTNTAYGRLYVFNIKGTSGTVSNLLPLLRDDTTAGWAAYVSLDSTEAVNIEYTADADGNVTLSVGGWSYPSQCSGFVAIDTLLNGNLNNNAASASGADGVLTAAFTGVALPNLAGAGTIDHIYINAVVGADETREVGIVFSDSAETCKFYKDGGNPLFARVCRKYDALLQSGCYGDAVITAENLGGEEGDSVIAVYWQDLPVDVGTIYACSFVKNADGTYEYGEIESLELSDGIDSRMY